MLHPEIPTNYLRCRALGHKWEEFRPVGKRKPEFGFRFSLLCVSCGMERHDVYDTLGRIATRQYDKPDGYNGLVSRADAKVAYSERRRKRAKRGDLIKLVP